MEKTIKAANECRNKPLSDSRNVGGEVSVEPATGDPAQSGQGESGSRPQPKWARKTDGYNMGSASTRLILVRHGITDWNAQGKFQGSSDVPLNDVGLAHAQLLADSLMDYGIDAIYSSPLTRAVQTATPIAQRLGLDIHTDRRLQELDAGEWEGLTISQITERDPDFLESIRLRHDHRRSPRGETVAEVGRRFSQALTQIAADHHQQTVLVSSHGLAMRAGTAIFTGLGMDGFWRLGDVQNCHWVMLGWHWQVWRILEYSVGPEMPALPLL